MKDDRYYAPGEFEAEENARALPTSTPCDGCQKPITVRCFYKEDFTKAMRKAGATWNMGWFCKSCSQKKTPAAP